MYILVTKIKNYLQLCFITHEPAFRVDEACYKIFRKRNRKIPLQLIKEEKFIPAHSNYVTYVFVY